MAVTASMVKELREMTGAGMMDCKKALSATDGDFDKAIEFLREKGLATAEKKAGRIAAEGLVATTIKDGDTIHVDLGRKNIKDGKSIKHKKAEQLKLAGYDIDIISENVFYDMIK